MSNWEAIKGYARRCWHPLTDDMDAIGNNYTLGAETGVDLGDPFNNNTLTSNVTDARGVGWLATYTPSFVPGAPLPACVTITLTSGGTSAPDEVLLQDPDPDTTQTVGD